MHSNELAQNSPDIVFVVRYLRICKGRGLNGGRTRSSRGSDKTRAGRLSPGSWRRSQVAGLLEGHKVVRRELLTLLEPLEDLLGFPLRVDLFRGRLRTAAALHPDPVDDLVVVVELADVLDVLRLLFARVRCRVDELLLGPICLHAYLGS